MSPAAQVVLLLHGQPGSARDWDGVVDELGHEAHAIAFDRPGWDGRRAPSDLAGNTAAAVEVLDSHRIERATVVGHSLGAAIAVRLAIERPERVAALVLASPAANAAALEWVDVILASPLAGSLISFVALSGAGLALATGPFRRLLAYRLGLEESYLKAASRELLSVGAQRAFLSEQRMLVRQLPELESRLGEIMAPTTIVFGSTDRLVPIAAGYALAQRIPTASVVVLSGAGHLIPQRHAAALADVIIKAAKARPRSPSGR